MLRKLLVAFAATFLLAACEQAQPVAAPPPPPPPPASPPQVFSVLFDTGRSTLTAPARATVQQAAAAYQSARGSGVTVTGHTDTTGSEQMNLALSQRRAQAVTDALVAAGVPGTSINSTATGEASLPVQTADNVSEQRNRSVDITIARMAGAGMSDADYCAALSARYRQLRTSQADETVAAAMYQCRIGNTAVGIPVIERALTDARIPLPNRT
jgi:hypothetical protein